MTGYIIDVVSVVGIVWALIAWNPQALCILIVSQIVFTVVGVHCRSVVWVDHRGINHVDEENRPGFLLAIFVKLAFTAIMFYGIWLLFEASRT